MRKPISIIFAFIIVVGLFSVWFFRERVFTETRFLMDTVCEIKVVARVKPIKAINKAFEAMREIDSLASFSGTGDITRINNGENFNLSPHILKIIDEGIKIGDLTQGAFDISIRPLMEVWKGFKTEEIPKDEIWGVGKFADDAEREVYGFKQNDLIKIEVLPTEVDELLFVRRSYNGKGWDAIASEAISHLRDLL